MRQATRAGMVYFAVVFAAGFVLGAARVGLVEPRLGPFLAVAAEVPVMLAIAWAAAGWIALRLAVPQDLSARAVMGGTGFGLLLLAEAALAAGLTDAGPAAVVAGWTTPAGALGLAGQVVFGLIPILRRGTT
jgi:hypothetical protein